MLPNMKLVQFPQHHSHRENAKNNVDLFNLILPGHLNSGKHIKSDNFKNVKIGGVGVENFDGL